MLTHVNIYVALTAVFVTFHWGFKRLLYTESGFADPTRKGKGLINFKRPFYGSICRTVEIISFLGMFIYGVVVIVGVCYQSWFERWLPLPSWVSDVVVAAFVVNLANFATFRPDVYSEGLRVFSQPWIEPKPKSWLTEEDIEEWRANERAMRGEEESIFHPSYDASGLGGRTLRDSYGRETGTLHLDGTITDNRGRTTGHLDR